MALRLTIENETSLPDGGPLSVTVSGTRGLDIGRDRHLDWTLPDPNRVISGKHCEIRYQDGGYMLFDVSTNGTFLDGIEGRVKGPHRLRNGERLIIGHYIIGVAIDGMPEPAADSRVVQTSSYEDLWNPTADAAPPIDRSKLRAPKERPQAINPDFLDWAADIPEPVIPSSPRPAPNIQREAPREFQDDSSWSRGKAKAAPAPEPPPAVPSPRRPVWTSAGSDNPWVPAPADGKAFEDPPSAAAPPPDAPPAPVVPVRREAALAPMPGPDLSGSDFANFIGHVARGAGVPEQVFANKNPDQLAEELGVVIRLVAENVRQLLNARLQAKTLARNANQTTIQAVDNNPLKFSATTEDALQVMFGKPTRSYLDARRALEQAFQDLKSHEIQTYGAMQQALTRLIADLDPQEIDKSTDRDGGITALVASRKAKLWDAYVMRWKAKTSRYEGGLLDVFMEYFAECYNRNTKS
jgi:type VI secretion system protein ImpI